MSHEAETGKRLRHLIAEIGDMAPDAICIDHKLEGNLGLDSLDRVELMMAIEDDFDIVFTDQEEEGRVTAPSATVADLQAAIERHLAANGARA
jgi:acyl carrier protein